MSVAAISWALTVKTGSSTAKLVLLKLADCANDDGIAWPSVGTIAEQTELSERAVRSQLRSLEKAGLIETDLRRDGAVNQSSKYRLRVGHVVPQVGQEVPGVGQEMPQGVGHHVPQGGAPRAPEPSIEPKTTSAAVAASAADGDEAGLYRRGREVLGDKAGGLIKRLVVAKGNSVAKARAAIEMAATKGDPREYVGAILNKPEQPPPWMPEGAVAVGGGYFERWSL